MKKTVSLLLLFAIIMGICGCSDQKKSSGVTINALQQVFLETDEDIAFEKTQTEKGYNFQYKNTSSIAPIEYSGKADAQENITSIKITNSKIDASVLKDEYKLKKIFAKSVQECTMNDLRVLNCFIEVMNLREAFGAKNSDDDIQKIIEFFTSSTPTMSVGNWTITADIENSSTVIISASYSTR